MEKKLEKEEDWVNEGRNPISIEHGGIQVANKMPRNARLKRTKIGKGEGGSLTTAREKEKQGRQETGSKQSNLRPLIMNMILTTTSTGGRKLGRRDDERPEEKLPWPRGQETSGAKLGYPSSKAEEISPEKKPSSRIGDK